MARYRVKVQLTYFVDIEEDITPEEAAEAALDVEDPDYEAPVVEVLTLDQAATAPNGSAP